MVRSRERSTSTATTSSRYDDHDGPTGFSGRGRTTPFVVTEGAEVFGHLDVSSDAAGNRIMAKVIFVMDPASGDIRVESGSLTCIHSVN